MRVWWALLAMAALVAAGCSAKDAAMGSATAKNASGEASSMPEADGATGGAPPSTVTPGKPGLTNVVSTGVIQQRRSMIRKASLVVRVDNVETAEKAANAFVAKANGFVEGTQSNDLSSDQAHIVMKIRVPVGAFETAIAAFEKLGVRTTKQISGEDVTGKVLDYNARLRVMRAQEEVYRNLLKNSKRLDEAISVQEQLMTLRENIESMTAQLKGLSELAALSTIELTLTQSKEAVAERQGDSGWFGEAWGGAKGAAFAFYRGVVVVLMWLVLFSPLWVGGIFLIRWSVKAAAKATAARPTPPPAPPRMDL